MDQVRPTALQGLVSDLRMWDTWDVPANPAGTKG
jgi:hypothetical protein